MVPHLCNSSSIYGNSVGVLLNSLLAELLAILNRFLHRGHEVAGKTDAV